MNEKNACSQHRVTSALFAGRNGRMKGPVGPWQVLSSRCPCRGAQPPPRLECSPVCADAGPLFIYLFYLAARIAAANARICFQGK